MHKSIELAKADIEEFDARRELVIKQARVALKEAKKAIYSVHRGNTGAVDNARKEVAKLKQLASSDLVPLLEEAEEEFVEAVCFASFPDIPSHKELGVSADVFFAGLCDCIGELVRKAMNAAISKNYDVVRSVHSFVKEVYDDLCLIDFRNGNVRRKFDSIKYGLERLENVLVEVGLKQK